MTPSHDHATQEEAGAPAALLLCARTLADAPVPTVALDLEGCIVAASAAARRLLRREELARTPLADVLPPAAAAAVSAALDRAVATGEMVEPEPAGMAHSFSGARLYPLRDAAGAVVGVGAFLGAGSPAAYDDLGPTVPRVEGRLPIAPYVTRPTIGSGVVHVGPQIEALTGHPPQAFFDSPGLWSTELLHPDDRERVLSRVEHSWGEGGVVYTEYRIVRRDGSVGWVADVTVPLDPPGRGDDRLFQGFLIDITQRKELELVHRAIIESAPDMLAITDLDGTVRFSSPRNEHVLGRATDEMVGRSFMDLVHPDDHPVVRTAVTDLRGSNVSEAVIRLVHASGALLHVQLRLRLSVDATGRKTIVGVARDITEARRAEERRREAEDRYRALAEKMPLVLYVDDPDSGMRPRYVSPGIEALLGFTAEEWLADSDRWRAQLHPEDRDVAVRRTSEAYALLEDRFELEYRLLHRDGRVVWVHDQVVLVRDEDGAPLYYQGFYLDVTERKELEARYLQSQRLEAVGRLAGSIVHDFNNVLTTVAGYAALLEQALAGEEQLQADAVAILAAAQRATALTRQLLAFSRGQVLQPRPLALNAVLEGFHGFLTQAAGPTVVVELELSPDDPWTFADPGQLEQVVLNLVVNARDALPDGGTVTIATGSAVVVAGEIEGLGPGRYASLVVADNGTGMRDEVRARMFEPFFTTKEAGEGGGFGLATVFGIVTQSGGHVAVESSWGVGTRITVMLPLRASMGEGAVEEPGRSSRPATSAVDLLLVEDDRQVREMTEQMLTTLGHRVWSLANGDEALASERIHSVDLVISDIVMPRVGGFELVERVRTMRPGLPILLISGHASGNVRSETLPPGVAFLEKPFSLESMKVAIDGLVGHGACTIPPPTG